MACTLKRREQVAAAIMQLTDGRGEIVEHSGKDWASITFSGTRHALVIDFEGSEAVDAGEDLVARLDEYEFSIPGQIVDDATITSVERVALMPALIVHAELLLLEEE